MIQTTNKVDRIHNLEPASILTAYIALRELVEELWLDTNMDVYEIIRHFNLQDAHPDIVFEVEQIIKYAKPEELCL